MAQWLRRQTRDPPVANSIPNYSLRVCFLRNKTITIKRTNIAYDQNHNLQQIQSFQILTQAQALACLWIENKMFWSVVNLVDFGM